jgi:hypothetical protein
MKQPYDPKLREAAEEFKTLCRKYDCAGFVLFVSPTHSEFVNHFGPTWSVVTPQGEHGVRFRSKREDWPTKEAQDAATEASAHMLTSVVEWSRQVNTGMRSVLEQLSKVMRIAWSAWDKPDSVPGDGL